MLINKIFITKKYLLNFLISFIPLSILIGNLAININVVLVCLLGIIIYRFQIFKINQKVYQYLLYGFFSYLILITLISNLPNLNIDTVYYKLHIFKSFFFLRFLVFFLVINKLAEEKSFNLKLFFISSAFFSFFLAADIYIQVIFGKDLLGYSITSVRPSGFFGPESIAGGYIQKFSLFFLFLIILNFFNKKNNKSIFYLYCVLIFFFTSILLTNNRMPSILYITSIFLFFLIEKRFKFLFITSFVCFICFSSLTKYSENLNRSFTIFYNNSKEIILRSPSLFYYNTINNNVGYAGSGHWKSSGYLLTFNSAIQTWKKNKILGGGLKSFKLNCSNNETEMCNAHPHNYILEILVDTGLIGFALIYSTFIVAILNFFKFYIKNFNLPSRVISVPFFLIIFFEFFPIRSSGSFFTTGVSVIIFLMLALLINVSRLSLLKKNYKKM